MLELSRRHHKNSTLKSAIGAVFFWNMPLPQFLQYIFLWTSDLQCILVLLWIQLEFIADDEKDNFSTVIYQLTKYSSLGNLVATPLSGLSTTLTFSAWIYFIFNFIVFGSILIKVYFKGQISKIENYAIFILSQFHISFGFWTVNVLCIRFAAASYIEEDSFTFLSEKIDTTLLKAICITIITVNYLMTTILATFSYDPLKSCNVFSVHTPMHQIHTFMLKAIILPFISVDMASSYIVWCFVMCSLMCSAFRHYKLAIKLPFYHFLPMKHSLLLSSIAFLVSILNTFIMTLKNIRSISCLEILYFGVLLITLILKANSQFLQSVINNNLQTETIRSSEDQIIKHLFAITYIIKSAKLTMNNSYIGKKVSELQLWSIWTRFYSFKEIEIDVKDTKQSNIYQKLQSIYLKQIEDIKIMILLESLQELKMNDKLKIMLADLLCCSNTFSPLAITNLLSIIQKKSLLQVEARKILQSIENKLHSLCQSGEDEILDIKGFVDYQDRTNHLVKMILVTSSKVLGFWESYKKQDQKILDLYQKSESIEKEDTKIRDFWSKFIEKDHKYASYLSTLYGIYLSLVRNSPYSAHQVQKQYKSYELLKAGLGTVDGQSGKISRKNLDSNKNAMIYVSMTKENLGKIINVSSNIHNIAGWKREDLLQGDVNILVPEFMREKHARYMLKHIENVVPESRLYKNIDTFIRDKEGYILQCYLYLCPYPYIQEEFIYIGIVRPKRSHNVEQIIVNQEGIVEGFTRGIDSRIQELLRKRTVQIIDPLKNVKDLFDPKKPIRMTEAESLSPLINHNNSSSRFLIGQQNEVETRRRLPELSRFKSPIEERDINKAAKIVDRYLHNYTVNKTFYSFDNDKFTVLNLEKMHTMLENRQATSRNYQLIKDENQQDETLNQTTDMEIPREDVGENNFEKSHTGLEREIVSNKTKKSSLFERLVKFNSKKEVNTDKSKQTLHKSTLIGSFSAIGSDRVPLELNQEKKNPRVLNSIHSSQNSSFSSQRICVEKAFYAVPNDFKVTYLGFFLWSFLVLSSFLLAYFQSANHNTLTLLRGNIDILNNQTLRLLNILNMNKMMVNFILADTGLVSLDRYSWAGVPDTRLITQIQLGFIMKDLNEQNIAIRNSIHKIDDNLKHKFYQKIPIIEQQASGNFTSSRDINPFDFIAEIIAAADRITARPFFMVRGTDEDVVFIFKNTLDDILSSGENAIDIITDDITQKLDTDMGLIILFTFIIVSMVFALIIFLSQIIRNIIEDREKILDVFLRLEEKPLEEHTRMLKKFSGILEKGSTDLQILDNELKKSSFVKSETQIAKAYGFKRRSANTQGINTGILRIILIIFCLFLFTMCGSIVVLAMISNQNKEVSREIGITVNINSNLYNIGVLILSIQEYIKDNTTTTLRGKPIKQEWEKTFNELTLAQEKFLTITDPNIGIGPNPILLEVIQGNLCQVIAPDPYAGAQCGRMLYGIIEKGLFRLNNFMISLVQTVKLSFDSSSKTREDMINILNMTDLIQSDPAMGLYLFPAFNIVGDLINKQLNQDLVNYGQRAMWVIIVLIINYLGFGGFLCYKLKNTLLYHKHSWRKLLRLVPSDMFTTNKLLQAYLLQSNKNVNSQNGKD